jgi:SAM-dependent methyltransferase
MADRDFTPALSRAVCPVCNATEAHTVLCPTVLAGEEPVYSLVECPACRTRFIHPLPDSEELKRFYAPHYYGADWYKQEGKGRLFGRVMLPDESYGRFLDAGCGLGFFLKGVRHNSRWQVYGTEISPKAVAFGRDKLGLDIRCGELESVGFGAGFFNYIHVSNVLEHLCDPLSFLMECRRILHTSGRLFLSVPNGHTDSASLIRFYRSEKRPGRSKDGHLFFFSKEALQYMFGKAGFKTVSSHTFGIRRGLSALGFYPRKPGWKARYLPQKTTRAQFGIQLPKLKKRLPGYYAYRFHQARLKRLPGLWKIGLDFEFILQAETTDFTDSTKTNP